MTTNRGWADVARGLAGLALFWIGLVAALCAVVLPSATRSVP